MPLQNIMKDSIHIVDYDVKKSIQVCFANMIFQTPFEKEYSVEDLKTKLHSCNKIHTIHIRGKGATLELMKKKQRRLLASSKC